MSGSLHLPATKASQPWKIAIVRSAWHPECCDAMADGAIAELKRSGIPIKNITQVVVPGSFEIPLMCQSVIKRKKVDGIIALGVIVQGRTHHARLIAEQAAAGVMRVQLSAGVPILFEVLYVDRLKDAKKRSIGKGNRGPLAARTLVATLAQQRNLR